MKNKTIIFLVLLVVLFVGALGSGAVFGQTDGDPGINIETLYGDMSALDGLKVGMSYVTHESLYWKSEVSFENGSMASSSDFRYIKPLKDQNWYNSWTDRENKRDKSVRMDVKELFSLRSGALAGEKKGYFYVAEDADISKAEGLPAGSGIYAMDYESSGNVEYVTNPVKDSVRLIADLGEGSTVKSMGFTEDEKYLEVFYVDGESLKVMTVDVSSEKTVSDMCLMPMEEMGEDPYYYYASDLGSEDVSDISMAASEKGFVLLKNENGKLTKAVERQFTKDDGPEGFANWTRKKAYRWLRTNYDGDRLVFCFRIAGMDAVNNRLSGTGVAAYGKEGLRYVGILTTELSSLDKAKIRDYYEEMYDPGWFDKGEVIVGNEISSEIWEKAMEEGKIDPETGEFYNLADEEVFDSAWSFETEDFTKYWEDEDIDDSDNAQKMAEEFIESLYYAGKESFAYFTVDYIN